MRRNVFLDPERQAELEERGYTIVRLLEPGEAEEVRREAERLRPADGFRPGGTGAFPNEYHCTFLDESQAYRRSVDELTRRWFGDRGLALLDDYRMLTSNLYVKPPGTGRLEIHQNWPVTDDIRDTSLTMWVPFHDMEVENGTLRLVPGSHKLVPDLFTLAAPKYFASFYDELIEGWLEPISVKAGECVLFDDSILHWSDVNSSDEARWGAQVILMPADKTPVLYHYDLDHDPPRFELYEIGPEYYTDHTLVDMMSRPDDLPLLGVVDRQTTPLDGVTFAALMAAGPAIRARVYAGEPIEEAFQVELGAEHPATAASSTPQPDRAGLGSRLGRWLASSRR